MRDVFIDNKPVWVSSHAIKQAEYRNIAFPDQIFDVLKTGKIEWFGKNNLKIIKKSRNGSIVCVGVDNGGVIVIKTIERGN